MTEYFNSVERIIQKVCSFSFLSTFEKYFHKCMKYVAKFVARSEREVKLRQTKTILSRISGAMRSRWCESQGGSASSNIAGQKEAGKSNVSWHSRGYWEHLRRERVFSCEIFVNIPLFVKSPETRKGLERLLHRAQNESRVERIKAFWSVRLTVKRILCLARTCASPTGPAALQRNTTYFAWYVSYD